jgi:hypothetical protein
MSADPITAYLAELRGLLRGSPRDNGRLLLELEAHLRDAQATAVAQGLVALDAAEVAVARVGAAATTAAAAEANCHVPALSLRVMAQALRLGAVLLVVLGLNGLLGEPLSWFVGMDFFFGDERTATAAPAGAGHLQRGARGAPFRRVHRQRPLGHGARGGLTGGRARLALPVRAGGCRAQPPRARHGARRGGAILVARPGRAAEGTHRHAPGPAPRSRTLALPGRGVRRGGGPLRCICSPSGPAKARSDAKRGLTPGTQAHLVLTAPSILASMVTASYRLALGSI